MGIRKPYIYIANNNCEWAFPQAVVPLVGILLMGDDVRVVLGLVYFCLRWPAHMNMNRVSLGVFEEVMRQKAGHGWS